MIPNSAKKKVINYKWYPEASFHYIQKSMNDAIEKVGMRTIEKQTLYKREIIALIKDIGIPERFTRDDWDKYIDDPMLDDDKQFDEINLKL